VNTDGTRAEPPLYTHDGYVERSEDPYFVEYPPERPLVLHPGEGIEWACTYHNDGPDTFEFGPNTARNEHCNLFGFYYPTDTPQEAIDCVHKLDDQGRDENLRIVAH
jgi:hypothetical protein